MDTETNCEGKATKGISLFYMAVESSAWDRSVYSAFLRIQTPALIVQTCHSYKVGNLNHLKSNYFGYAVTDFLHFQKATWNENLGPDVLMGTNVSFWSWIGKHLANFSQFVWTKKSTATIAYKFNYHKFTYK